MSNPSSTPTLKALREMPAARIYAVGASAASLVELLGAVLGNPDTALATLRTLLLNGGWDLYWQKRQVLPLAVPVGP